MKNAIHIYNLLLNFYPRRYRHAFGAQMLQTFIDHYEDIERSEGRVNPGFWLSMLVDEIKNMASQHVIALTDAHDFLKVTGSKLVVSAVFVIPFYIAFCLLLVNISLALPHPPVSGIGAIIALSALLFVLPSALSLMVSYILASALVSFLPKRKVGQG